MKNTPTDLEAVGLALAGFTFWVFADTTIKMVGSSRLPAYEVLAFLGLSITALLAIRGVWLGQVKALWPKRPKRQLVRSCLDLGNNICVVVALRHLPLSLFYILVFMSPMVITLLSAVFLQERLEWRRSLAILAGFGGVVIAVDPFGKSRQGDWVGVAACMVCVGCFSSNMVWVRVMTQTETPESLTFLSGALMAVTGIGCMLLHAEPVTMRLGAMLGAMGLFCAAGSLCFFVAVKHASAASVSQYHYTQLITGSLLGYLIWHEKPNLFMMIGGAVILLSGVYIALVAARQSREELPLFPFVSFKE